MDVWTWYECEFITWSISATDTWCGNSGLTYQWIWFVDNNTTTTNAIYSNIVTIQTGSVVVTDAAWNSTEQDVIYQWIDNPVTWHNFYVWNVWNGVTVNWKEEAGAQAWDCETISASVKEDGSIWICTINGNELIYTWDGVQTWNDMCILTIRDDDGSVDVVVTLWSVGPTNPEVLSLTWWFGWTGICTNENIYIVTWIFNKNVIWVSINSLIGSNVEITDFEKVSDMEYIWTVKLLWWLWTVWLTWDITDEEWRELIWGDDVLPLADYDGTDPEFTVNEAEWFECEMITGSVDTQTWDSCGKDSLDKFRYNWNNLGWW